MDISERKRLIALHKAEEQRLLAPIADELKQHRSAVDKLLRECTHEFRPLTKGELEDEWMSEIAICTICKENFGWRCKESPDGTCHYCVEDGKVCLIDGTEVEAPKGWENRYECIYCEMPDERK